VFLSLLVLVIAFPSLFAPHSPYAQDLTNRLRPPFWQSNALPGYYLGTDVLGRDVLSRLIYGARSSLLVALAAVALAGLIGIALGVLSGYAGGAIDSFFMRLADTQLAIPFILLAVGVVGAIGPSTTHLIVVLSLTAWVVFARVARAESMRLKNSDYIYVARGMGGRTGYLLYRHLLPNAATPLIVIAALQIAVMVFNAAALSFLGLGIQEPTPNWGSMMSEGQDYIYVAWWLITLPGVLICLTLMALNITGEWVSDVMGGVEA
jgi:peptide/nickel transport system permease protein